MTSLEFDRALQTNESHRVRFLRRINRHTSKAASLILNTLNCVYFDPLLSPLEPRTTHTHAPSSSLPPCWRHCRAHTGCTRAPSVGGNHLESCIVITSTRDDKVALFIASATLVHFAVTSSIFVAPLYVLWSARRRQVSCCCQTLFIVLISSQMTRSLIGEHMLLKSASFVQHDWVLKQIVFLTVSSKIQQILFFSMAFSFVTEATEGTGAFRNICPWTTKQHLQSNAKTNRTRKKHTCRKGLKGQF